MKANVQIKIELPPHITEEQFCMWMESEMLFLPLDTDNPMFGTTFSDVLHKAKPEDVSFELDKE